MIDEEDLHILDSAIETWGKFSQFQMAFGECGEFIALAGRIVQDRATNEEIIDEVADVTIMMRQIAISVGEDAVRKRIKYKMGKIVNKLKNAGVDIEINSERLSGDKNAHQ